MGSFLTKVHSALGFAEAPAKWWAWGIIITFIGGAIVTFFLTFSLARHKRALVRLQGQVLRLDAEGKAKDFALKRQDLRLKELRLSKDEKRESTQRAKLRQELQDLEARRRKFEPELKKVRAKAKSEDTKKLLNETTVIVDSLL